MTRRQGLALVIVLVVGAGALFAVVASSRDPETMLVNTYDLSPAVFTFKYPTGWQYRLLMQNLLMLAQPPTFEGTPGPTLTVQRSFPLAAADSLNEALATYLNEGPLREDRQWEIVDDISTIMFDGRQALALDLEGREADDKPELHTHLVITEAANGAVYIFAASAPVGEWEQYRAVFEAILESVEIME